MPMSIRTQPEAGYLYAEFAGEFALSEAQTLTAQYLEACIELKLARVLVDTRRVSGKLSVTERFHYADFVARRVIEAVGQGRLEMPQLAYVGSSPLLDPEKFGVTVALNRGVRTTTVETIDEALRWLGVAAASE